VDNGEETGMRGLFVQQSVTTETGGGMDRMSAEEMRQIGERSESHGAVKRQTQSCGGVGGGCLVPTGHR